MKWEYDTLSDEGFNNHHEWLEALNLQGQQGWELVTIVTGNHFGTSYTVAYFKRVKAS